MNKELAQLVAEQVGNGGVNGVDPGAWVSALAQNGADPLTAMLLSRMLATPREAPVEKEEVVDDELRDREVTQLRRALARARSELASADVMARYIAETFGTCDKCWGLNQLCSQCEGKGGPGYRSPDAETLRAWVEPALQKVGLAIVAPS